MTSDGRIGAVAAVRDVPHPIRLALRVLETPHVLLAGEGARRFAELHGLVEPFGPSPHAREAYERCRARAQAEPDRWLPHWNFATAPDVPAACDTIGAVAMDREGRLAVANSTGGASPMLLGRVGDSPLVGCGFYCSPAAAVAATGHGETIIRHMLSRAAHDHIAQGDTAERALARALAKMGDAPAGLIAIHRGGVAGASNRTMPCSFRVAARG
jgi:L-asparaginase/beta-aspartyl-peptidase (threonine type)